MATEQTAAPKRAIIAMGILGLAVLLAWWVCWRGRPPHLTADDDVYRSVDGLFTAVTAHDKIRLAQSEQRLHAFKGAGKLTGNAADYLDNVITQARDGQWESAAQELYDFMAAQRR